MNTVQRDDTTKQIDPWKAYLDPGEEILWHGSPDGKIRLRARNLVISAFGIFFFGFSIFWTLGAANSGDLIFPLFGLPFMAVGFYLVFGTHFFDAHKRRHSYYTLTNKRAFIATNILTKKIKSYAVNAETDLEFQPGPPASIYFAKEMKSGQNGSYTVPVGFEYVADGDTLYKLFRQVQRAAA